MRKSSKANRRYMRNMYRKTFFHPEYSRGLVRSYMRRFRRGEMFNPGDSPEVFGTDPLHWPKNRYQWRMIMTEKLKSEDK